MTREGERKMTWIDEEKIGYCKHATKRAHLTLISYFLRWVPQFSNFGI